MNRKEHFEFSRQMEGAPAQIIGVEVEWYGRNPYTSNPESFDMQVKRTWIDGQPAEVEVSGQELEELRRRISIVEADREDEETNRCS